MTPTQLRTYASIVRHGSSKAAAAELDVSEAAVSNHVASLRKELDDELFHRSGTGLSFTPGGLRLATRAVELLGLQDQTRLEVKAAASGRRVLRLAVSSLFGELCAPGLIELFSTRAKDLDVEMAVHPAGDVPALLASRGADIAIGPSLRAVDGQFVATEFLRYTLVVVAAPNHRFAGRRLTPGEMAEATWYLGPSAVEAGGVAHAMLANLAIPEARQRIFQSHAAALDEARGGQGLAVMPENRVAKEIAAGSLVRVDGPGTQASGTWSALTLPRDRGVSPAAAELARFVSTPRAIQSMLTGSGANITHFRPSVHVTLWS
ncbi:MAG: LysR family transcriptional regulator [Acidimicrobiales bacterium]